MNDFGPKRPMSEDSLCESTDTVKAKRGRPKKKPDYDRDKEIEAFQQKVKTAHPTLYTEMILKISLQTKLKRKIELICFALQSIITVDYRLEVRYGLFILC